MVRATGIGKPKSRKKRVVGSDASGSAGGRPRKHPRAEPPRVEAVSPSIEGAPTEVDPHRRPTDFQGTSGGKQRQEDEEPNQEPEESDSVSVLPRPMRSGGEAPDALHHKDSTTAPPEPPPVDRAS